MDDNILINGPNLNSKSGTIKQLIVFLHGWGSNGDDLIQLAPSFINEFPDAYFLSPNGPETCPQNPFGGRQWFNLDFLPNGSLDRSKTPEKTKKAANSINMFLDYWQDKFSVIPSDTFLIGFSQGSMMALEVGTKRQMGGLLCFSGSLINSEEALSYKPNIMLIHGEIDDIIPVKNMFNAEKQLKDLGANINVFECKGLGHSIDEIGIKKGIDFIKECTP